ncbi:MAG: UDP-N-acetylmuramate--L-alanine ligase [Anaerolineaceae bacterium]|nr:UDP-N-acetylmuramate--L-alanine ligase [Anaerolineaceae bacterium]
MKKLSEMKIHIIGIGGTGMAPIAIVLHEMGTEVSGSDRAESVYTQDLRSRGIQVFVPQCAENIKEPDLVFYSSAIHDDNPELAEARRRGIRTLKRREFLGFMLSGRKVTAVAGSHGKSTTTSMLTWVFEQLGLDPGFIVGSSVKDLGRNASAGSGDDFIIEADEYDNMFLGLEPFTAALTKVEYDHPDCFPTPEIYMDAFQNFLNKSRAGGFILLNADDDSQRSLRIPEGRNVYRYGIENDADFNAAALSLSENGCYTFLFENGEQRVSVSLAVPGKHNVYNALLVLSVCAVNGYDVEKASEALGSFHGISRRFELTADWNGIKLIDDYAHHPTEIRATLRAAREYYPGHRIRAVWQPHTFSRTKSLLHDFAVSFTDADEVIITDIFAARESYTDFGINDVMQAVHHPDAKHLGTNQDVAAYLARTLVPGDVVVTLSAGDANKAAPMAMEIMKHAGN